MGRIANIGSKDHAIAALAGRQHGVVSRRQLRGLGLTDDMIDARASRGRLHRVFRDAYAVGHRAVGRKGHLLAAVLACGEGSVVSHGSAAELLELWDKTPVLVNVIGRDQTGRKLDGIRWHRVSLPDPDEMTFREGIPCTGVARTLVDMAGSLGRTPLRRLVEQAAVLRLLDVAEVDRVLAGGRRRGTPQLREILVDWRDQQQPPHLRSVLEARLFPALAAAGLSRPQCNAKLWLDGRRLEVDLLWPDQRLVIETDGEQTHGTRAAFHRLPVFLFRIYGG
jgi:hypothetical protein